MSGSSGEKTGSGINDNDSIFGVIDNVQGFDSFMLMSTAGAMDVFVSLDGTNFTTSALSLVDLGAEDTNPVIVTAANRLYGFRGKFKKIRVDQNGATAVENAVIKYGVM